MENEFERILHVFDAHSNDKDKIDCLLRQVESLVDVKNYYREQIVRFQEREENLKAILLRANECYVNNQDMLVNVNIIKALGELGVINYLNKREE